MAKPYTIDSMSMAGTTPIKISGKIEFDRVDFAYPTRPNVKVLTGFSLSIPAGSTTALVGPSGCGKSTIVKLLQRFYDPSHGTIFLDGRPLTSLSLRWLRENMAVVHQDTDLFNASVYDNIRYGLLRSRETLTNQQERDKIMDAAEAVGLHHIIMSMPDGYQTSVGEKGSRLSGERHDTRVVLFIADGFQAVNGRGWRLHALSSAVVKSCFSTRRLPPWTQFQNATSRKQWLLLARTEL